MPSDHTNEGAASRTDIELLNGWLKPLDQALLECDGMSRAISTLLHKNGIAHSIQVGCFTVESLGDIEPHFWIVFPDGAICDFRARMWLREGDEVPHGVFYPTSSQQYHASGVLEEDGLSPLIFEILTGMNLDEYGPPEPLVETNDPVVYAGAPGV